MPPREVRPGVEGLRSAVAARVEATSLRGVAREVGMSAPGLQSFLAGTTPHPATLRKLEAWYVRESVVLGAETGTLAASAAITVLIRDLPENRRAMASRRTITFLEGLYAEEGSPGPVWLRELRAGLERA